MKKIIIVIFAFTVLALQLKAQNLTEEQVSKIKKASAFIQVKHSWLPTDEEYTPSGSGFFISPNGHLITNYHVIESKLNNGYGNNSYPSPVKEIVIVCNSGSKNQKKYKASILAANKTTDLAILQIEDTVKTPYIELDSISKPNETQTTWVFGYPFGERFSILQYGPEISVTKGIVSAIRHNEKGVYTKLQLDAVANFGNSGGPAINEQGKIVAVVSSGLKDAKLCFGVPVHYLSELLKEVDLSKHIMPTDSVTTDFTSNPTGADVFVDFKKVGSTPLFNVKVKAGYHNVCVVKTDYLLFIKNYSFLKHDTIKSNLLPINPSIFTSVKESNYKKAKKVKYKKNKDNEEEIKFETSKRFIEPPSNLKSYFNDFYSNKLPKEQSLREDDFLSSDSISNWKQCSGGDCDEDQDSEWYIENSMLNEFDEDNLMHAIFMGDTTWTNYAVKAKVKIPHQEGTGGIIFRANKEGFYVFCISREKKIANLAYHINSPFGWVTIKESRFDFTLEDKWYTLSAIIEGDNINCFINDKCVISTTANNLSSNGNVGFFSVYAKSQFDSLYISKINDNIGKTITHDTDGFRTLYIYDNFDFKSTSWYPYTNTKTNPQPWYMLDEGCALLDEDTVYKYMELTKYKFEKYSFDLDITTIKGTDKSVFVMYYKKNENEIYRAEFHKKNLELKLFYINGTETKLLKTKKIDSDFFDKNSTIHFSVKDKRLNISESYEDLISYKIKDISKTSGYFGFGSCGLKILIHNLSIRESN